MDEKLRDQLESLAEGETLEVEEDGDLTIYLKTKTPIPCSNHKFKSVGNNEEICVLCGQGRVS